MRKYSKTTIVERGELSVDTGALGSVGAGPDGYIRVYDRDGAWANNLFIPNLSPEALEIMDKRGTFTVTVEFVPEEP
jgi:hypothetical protein